MIDSAHSASNDAIDVRDAISISVFIRATSRDCRLRTHRTPACLACEPNRLVVAIGISSCRLRNTNGILTPLSIGAKDQEEGAMTNPARLACFSFRSRARLFAPLSVAAA